MFKRKPDYSQCPFLKGDCMQRACALWTSISGQDPQTGQPMQKEMCALAASVLVQLDTGRNTSHVVGQMQAARNEAAERSKAMPQILRALPLNGSD